MSVLKKKKRAPALEKDFQCSIKLCGLAVIFTDSIKLQGLITCLHEKNKGTCSRESLHTHTKKLLISRNFSIFKFNITNILF